MERPFQLFGPSHLGALAATLLLAAALTRIARREPAHARSIERALAVLLLSATALYIAIELASGEATLWSFLPFHLCDLAIFVAVIALFTRDRLACETVYSWGFSGTLLAMVTPDLATDIPGRDYFFYFGLHAGVVVAAAALTFGAGLHPRPWAPVRVWLLTSAYAGVIALFNLAFDTNYMYLCARPDQPSPLDWFGPWPAYILVADLVALALFSLLHLPFALARRAARAARSNQPSSGVQPG